jgi:hypothetical protein
MASTRANDDTSWAHDNPDNEYAAESLSSVASCYQYRREGHDDPPFLDGARQKLNLKLVKTRSFKNGNVLLCYRPA